MKPDRHACPARPEVLIAPLRKLVSPLLPDGGGGWETFSFRHHHPDSPALAGVAEALEETFGVRLTPRQLIEECPNLESLADRLIREAPDLAAEPHSWCEVSGMSEADKRQLLIDWNATGKDLGPDRCLHELIGGPAGKVAVSQGDVQLTYGELEARANAIAARLQKAGVGPDDLVGVFADRHPRTVAGLLGILKAGGAYVPLDPEFPEDRLRMMMEDASLSAVLTTDSLRPRLPDLPVPVMKLTEETREQPVRSRAQPGCLAYVIYTSGSTGRPKGVQIEHRAIVNFLRSMGQEPGIEAESVLVAITTLCFDISLLELFLPLISGARVEMATREQATNPGELQALLQRCGATHLQATPVTWRLLAEHGWAPPPRFRMLCGGEPMPLDLAQKLAAHAESEFWNLYGPTETTVWSTAKRLSPDVSSITVGRPIANTTLYVLDDHLQPVPPGVPGRLFIGGLGLARGYRGRPELTAEKFIASPFPSPLGNRIYDTGDLARYRPDGELECLGRSDTQLKYNGYRIEAGDIESALRAHPIVREAVVKMVDQEGCRSIWGYVTCQDGEKLSGIELRTHLRETLPSYMIPSRILVLDEFPLTPNRKIDRRALPESSVERVVKSSGDEDEPRGPESETSSLASERTSRDSETAARKIERIWADLLGRENAGREVNFFDAGGHSLLLLRLKDRLQEVFERPVDLAALFQHTTIESQANLVASPAGRVTPALSSSRDRPRHREIAVIGMSLRVPGASGVQTFWENLRQGVESLSDFSEDSLRSAGVSGALLQNPHYVRRGSVIEDADAFDHELFGISPREAELMDPQHRVLLEECYKTLEDGGYDPARYPFRIGVFAGCGEPPISRAEGLLPSEYYVGLTGSQVDYLTTRIAYRLNLRGPALTVQTGCSTSLVALHAACQSLLLGECEMALAGGITLLPPSSPGYLYEEGMMLSPDGRCRPFDAAAEGTVFTQGAGVVLLKPLDQAVAEGDHIRAVIRGSAINNDGSEKIGFTAPSVEGQARVIQEAFGIADVDPRTIGLVETHGTGTPLGDPIELAALTRAFQTQTTDRNFCWLGALKGNVGHMDAAAGICSFIKAVLALQHGEVPAIMHFREPNPKLELENSPFQIPVTLTPWQGESKGESDRSRRRAAVSSFGIGGTNAHVILEEAPPVREDPSAEAASRRWQILTFSSKSASALDATSEKGLAALEARVGRSMLADIAFTLSTGRPHHGFREARVATPDGVGDPIRGEARPRPVVFLFPGQGTTRHGMAHALHASEPAFRIAFDACDEILHACAGWRLSETLFAEDAHHDWSATHRAQPALFAVEMALARLWQSWGVEPTAMIGHSIGEFTAACLAGVFSLEDAVRVVAERGRLMQHMMPGAMIAVSAEPAAVAAFLAQKGASIGVEIAVENSPRCTIVAGTDQNVKEFTSLVETQGWTCRRLQTSHAFHSHTMEEAARQLGDIVGSVKLHAPQIPYFSNVSGQWITAEQATCPDYWCTQLRSTVRFSSAVDNLSSELGEVLFLEMGPGQSLSTFVRQHERDHITVATMPASKEELDEEKVLAQAVGAFWAQGGSIDWHSYHAVVGGPRRRVPLPGYAMQRRPFTSLPVAGSAPKGRPSATDWTTWLHEVHWKPLPPLAPAPAGDGAESRTFLFSRTNRLGAGHPNWTWIAPGSWGSALDQLGNGDPAVPLRLVVDALDDEGQAESDATVDAYEAYHEQLFDPLMQLLAEVSRCGFQGMELIVLTPGGADLEGPAPGSLPAAAWLGACLSLQQDLPNLRCRVVNLPVSEDPKLHASALRDQNIEPLVAIRGRTPYKPEYLPYTNPTPGLSAVPGAGPLLSGEGAIVITGGFGAIGLACAEWFRKHTTAPVVLAGRLRGGSDHPASGFLEGDRIPADQREKARDGEAEGRFTYYRADLSRSADVEQLLRDVETRHGGLAGVVHAAGVIGTVSLETYEPCARQAIQEGKVHGALHLAAALRDRRPRFVLLLSSISSVLGGMGYEAYASANAVLDQLARQEDGFSSTRWLSLGLDAVATSGLPKPQEMDLRQAAELVGFYLGLSSPPGRLVVSKTALSERLQRWVYGMTETGRGAAPAAMEPGDRPPQGSGRVERIQAVWSAILKAETVGADDNFFDLGGDSIMAIPVFQELSRQFGVSLPIATLFEAPTPRALAEHYPEAPAAPGSECLETLSSLASRGLTAQDGVAPSPFSPNLVVKMKGGQEGKPPIFFTHPGGGSIVFYHGILDVMTHGHPMYGIESPLLSQARFDLRGMDSIEEVAEGYTSLVREVRPRGPYILAGYSFGGLVSLEMARLLLGYGEDVHLMVFDTPNPIAGAHTNNLGERMSYHWHREIGLGDKLLTLSKRAGQGVLTRLHTTVARAGARRLNARAQRPSSSPRVLNFQILEIYEELTRKYAPKPFHGDLYLLAARDRGDKVVHESDLGWGEVIQGELRIVTVPGDHLSLFEGAHAEAFVRAMENCLPSASSDMILER